MAQILSTADRITVKALTTVGSYPAAYTAVANGVEDSQERTFMVNAAQINADIGVAADYARMLTTVGYALNDVPR